MFISYHSSAQKNKNETFIKEWEDFRYSLYQYLDTIRFDNYSLFDLPEVHPLNLSIQKFLDDHKGDISDYQKSVLEDHEDSYIEFSNYRTDTNFLISTSRTIWDADWNEITNKYNKEKDHPVIILLTINPFIQSNHFLSMYLARLYEPKELGERTFKNTIAQPKISTK